jgi:hypothetical protein
MDEVLRSLERRALNGDLRALDQYRRLALKLDLIPETVIHVLAGYGYQPAQEMVPRYQWPNSTSQAFDWLFHRIPHNANAAAIIRYRVLAAAYDRMMDEPDVIEILSSLNPDYTDDWEFRIQGRKPIDIIQAAIALLKLMTQEDYYDDLCIRSQRDYIQSPDRHDPWGGTFYPKDPLVQQHDNAKKDCEAVGHLLRYFQSGHASPHLVGLDPSRAIFSLGDAVSPKLAGFEGVSQLNDMLHSIRYFLDGMDFSWSNNAHIEAIFSYYLI